MDKTQAIYNSAKSYYKKGNHPNNPFTVYEVQLFYKLFGHKRTADYDVKFSAFKNILNTWLDEGREFDKAVFLSEVKARITKEHIQRFDIIFGIPVKLRGSAVFPFKRSLKVKNIKFTRKSYEQVKKVVLCYVTAEAC